ATRAAGACSGAAPAAPVFNAAGDDRTGARFWLDSLLNEAVVHGFDAAATAGHDHDVDTDVAAALITNHLAMLTSPTWTARRPDSVAALRGTGQTLLWRATGDPGLEWRVERHPGGARRQPGGGTADVIVQGPAKRPATSPSTVTPSSPGTGSSTPPTSRADGVTPLHRAPGNRRGRSLCTL
ncbi:hypothetical protein AB0M71_45495, partial [Amycolatopsis sp. NPDC051114]